MSDLFIIYIDRLKSEEVHRLQGLLLPDFFEIQEKELLFLDPVELSGEVYLAGEELILHLSASTFIRMPCAICNEMLQIPLAIQGAYHAEPVASCTTGQFDLRPVLREALLLELPQVAECPGGCKERESLAPYMHKKPAVPESPETYFPFSDLNYPS